MQQRYRVHHDSVCQCTSDVLAIVRTAQHGTKTILAGMLANTLHIFVQAVILDSEEAFHPRQRLFATAMATVLRLALTRDIDRACRQYLVSNLRQVVLQRACKSPACSATTSELTHSVVHDS